VKGVVLIGQEVASRRERSWRGPICRARRRPGRLTTRHVGRGCTKAGATAARLEKHTATTDDRSSRVPTEPHDRTSTRAKATLGRPTQPGRPTVVLAAPPAHHLRVSFLTARCENSTSGKRRQAGSARGAYTVPRPLRTGVKKEPQRTSAFVSQAAGEHSSRLTGRGRTGRHSPGRAALRRSQRSRIFGRIRQAKHAVLQRCV